jgi:hypothetical protein
VSVRPTPLDDGMLLWLSPRNPKIIVAQIRVPKRRLDGIAKVDVYRINELTRTSHCFYGIESF